ncbi:MAG: DNA alkylation repair protein [Cytophagales bacterium]|nr:DNA alkylation repair protein [Cytophagales bacterium]
MTTQEVIKALRALGTEHHRNQFARFGIVASEAFGVKSPDIQKLAKQIGKNHELAVQLFEEPHHEAKLITAFLAEPKLLTKELMDHWASQVYSWDLCDNLCMHLFRRSPLAEEVAYQWVMDDREFVRRCGLVLMTSLSIHNKKASNEWLLKYIEAATPYVTDERNFVKKAVSWLLRSQGKRNLTLRTTILEKCDQIATKHPTSKSVIWIISDVRRELMKKEVLERLERKEG